MGQDRTSAATAYVTGPLPRGCDLCHMSPNNSPVCSGGNNQGYIRFFPHQFICLPCAKAIKAATPNV